MMTTQETYDFFTVELEHVIRQLRAGRVNNDDVEILRNIIFVIRQSVAPQGTEEEIVARYRAANTEKQLAETDMAAHFWPIVRTATTEAEARSILNRVPPSVEKSFFVDHFVYVSKIIPKREN